MNDWLNIPAAFTYPLRYSQQFCERENKIINEDQKIERDNEEERGRKKDIIKENSI